MFARRRARRRAVVQCTPTARYAQVCKKRGREHESMQAFTLCEYLGQALVMWRHLACGLPRKADENLHA